MGFTFLRMTLAIISAVISSMTYAAAGQHGVDDAAVMDKGQCKLEGWWTHGHGDNLMHAGTGCRVGPVELGIAAEHDRAGGGSASAYGLQ